MKFLWTILSLLFVANVLFVPFSAELDSIKGLLRKLIDQVDLNGEGNFAAWYSSMLLVLNACVAGGLAYSHSEIRRPVALRSALIAFGFLLLSCDEYIGVHEYIEDILIDDYGVQEVVLSIGPYFALCLGAVLLSVIAGPYLRAVQHGNLPFLIACFACIVTVGLAEFASDVPQFDGFWSFRLEVVCEECSELSALLLFLTFQIREMRAVGMPFTEAQEDFLAPLAEAA